jgi:hypothetical protein
LNKCCKGWLIESVQERVACGCFRRWGAHFFWSNDGRTPRKPVTAICTEPSVTGSRKERIRKLLTKLEQKLDLEGKVTLADLIRLTQLEREL